MFKRWLTSNLQKLTTKWLTLNTWVSHLLTILDSCVLCALGAAWAFHLAFERAGAVSGFIDSKPNIDSGTRGPWFQEFPSRIWTLFHPAIASQHIHHYYGTVKKTLKTWEKSLRNLFNSEYSERTSPKPSKWWCECVDCVGQALPLRI